MEGGGEESELLAGEPGWGLTKSSVCMTEWLIISNVTNVLQHKAEKSPVDLTIGCQW